MIKESPSDAWIRVLLEAGDLFILPACIYQCFTLDVKDNIKVMPLQGAHQYLSLQNDSY